MSCPRCGADNQCAVALADTAAVSAGAGMSGCVGDPSCWCFQVPLSPAQSAMLPASTSCYCKACLEFLVREIPG